MNALQQLEKAINDLPRNAQSEQLMTALSEALRLHDHRTAIIKAIGGNVEELRDEIVHMTFDLECTKRERDQYKEAIER